MSASEVGVGLGLSELSEEGAVTEIACRELGTNSAEEEHELRILEAAFDLELTEAEHLQPAIDGLLLDELARRPRVSAAPRSFAPVAMGASLPRLRSRGPRLRLRPREGERADERCEEGEAGEEALVGVDAHDLPPVLGAGGGAEAGGGAGAGAGGAASASEET